MTILAFPDITPTRITWGLIHNVAAHTNPLTGTTQTSERSGAKWKASLNFQNLNDEENRIMQAFLAQVGRGDHYFRVQDYSFTLRGAGGGTPLVNGASQTGRTLVTDGWPVSTTVLKAGDLFNAGTNGQLLMVREDVTSDGSGNATIKIEPELRDSPADNATIDTSAPTIAARMATPEYAVGVAAPVRASLSFDVIEDFDAA